MVEGEGAFASERWMDTAESGVAGDIHGFPQQKPEAADRWRVDPLGLIRDRFAHEVAREASANPDVLGILFRDLPEASTLPLLTQTTPRGSLVRFVCFVQDVLEQEMYMFRYGSNGSKTAICADVISDPELENQPMIREYLSERLPLYCTTIPGLSDWNLPAKPGLQGAETAGNGRAVAAPIRENANHRKRPYEPQADSMSTGGDEAEIDLRREKSPPTAEGNIRPTNKPMGYNIPLVSDSLKGAFGAVLKVYHRDIASQPLLNHMLEITGIVEDRGAVLNSFCEDDGSPSDLDLSVMRLHALKLRDLGPLDVNNYTESLSRTQQVSLARSELCTALPAVRGLLNSYVCNQLGGDHLASEYLLSAMVSHVAERGNGTIVGKIALNLVLPSGMSSKRVIDLVQSLCARSAIIPINIERLNSGVFNPSKDYSKNRLCTSCLQLPAGTVVILDETELCPGQLNQRGLRNIATLKDLVNRQQVSYDFQFYQMDVNVDLPVIVLSTSKSLVPCDVVIRCMPQETVDTTVFPLEEAMQKMRMAVALLADPSWEFHIPMPVVSEIEQTFVKQRKESPSTTTQESLSSLLSFARTYSRTFGESHLSVDRWRAILELDAQRRSRL
eukprot:Plantae.Rhodophyta-Purpureofilum_apyrenoidigerum.ctg24557.p1 GENE.Plantae.Rhodophyta-Purpureofilum_apyrenoidigerum.ctg24557~~Plantae.Rhodophyta-Purpureofilum_apyrenoidigerum.ctg24557.p1  ORF type:complete len:631 (-),score=88.18 Plantae.Rhodophyta-Purpureofilum_apyrenoidigerum.ctg24557:93-1940(-)